VTVSSERPVVVLVHGAWHGPWCWELVQDELAALGLASRAVALPSALVAGHEGGPDALLPGVADDAAVIAAALADIPGPALVVGHSYGGIPVAQATAGGANVTHVVYVAAYLLDVGESLATAHGAPARDPRSATGVAGLMSDPAGALYSDVPEPARSAAVARLLAQSARSFAEPLTAVSWHTLPTTYVVCDDDRALPPTMQEKMAGRAGATHHLASGHSPFLSMPGPLAALLSTIAG
jgi:pimeloyl-ACP methyl ester carboxylesterase